jgi:hypothetical protein
LEAEGYISRRKQGRGNIYQINHENECKHDLTRNLSVGDLLELLSHKGKSARE